jgi:hypothetical protein
MNSKIKISDDLRAELIIPGRRNWKPTQDLAEILFGDRLSIRYSFDEREPYLYLHHLKSSDSLSLCGYVVYQFLARRVPEGTDIPVQQIDNFF